MRLGITRTRGPLRHQGFVRAVALVEIAEALLRLAGFEANWSMRLYARNAARCVRRNLREPKP